MVWMLSCSTFLWHLVLSSPSPLPSPFLTSNIGSVREMIEMIMLNDRKYVAKGGVTSEGTPNSSSFQVNQDVCPGTPWRSMMAGLRYQ